MCCLASSTPTDQCSQHLYLLKYSNVTIPEDPQKIGNRSLSRAIAYYSGFRRFEGYML